MLEYWIKQWEITEQLYQGVLRSLLDIPADYIKNKDLSCNHN